MASQIEILDKRDFDGEWTGRAADASHTGLSIYLQDCDLSDSSFPLPPTGFKRVCSVVPLRLSQTIPPALAVRMILSRQRWLRRTAFVDRRPSFPTEFETKRHGTLPHGIGRGQLLLCARVLLLRLAKCVRALADRTIDGQGNDVRLLR